MNSFSYIDIHTHVNFAAFDPVRSREGTQRVFASNGVDSDRDAVIKRALDAGVAMVNVGTQRDTSQKAVELAEQYESGVYACIGVHPIHSDKSFHDEKELGKIPPAEDGSAPFGKGRIQSGGFVSRGEIFDREYYFNLAAHPKVVAIGECGLDYYHDTNIQIEDANDTNKKQEENFRKQIELAIEIEKPLMLHIRNSSNRSAYKDAFQILSTYNFKRNTHPGNLHFFAGSIAEARPFLDAGFTFSFTGVITFTRDYDEIIRYLPLDRILSETDAPYVAPAPYRGKRNEPSYVVEVVKAIADAKHEKLETVKERILANAAKLFNLFQ